MSAAIFNGTSVKVLKNILKFKDGTTLSSTIAGYLANLTSDAQSQLNTLSVNAIKNYVSNGNADVDTTGWATYADAAGTSPVDGTAGSPTTTFTRSTSSPLRGAGSFLLTKDAANRQGEGASYAFTIDTADQARVLNISFDYLVSSGTFVAGTGTTDSDVTVWIYDVTNAAIIQPTNIRLYSNSTGVADKFSGTFQTASNSTSYRLIIHVGSTSASAYTLKIDDVRITQVTTIKGSVVSDWQTYTPTGSWVSNTTYTGIWRREGDSARIRIYLLLGGAPTSAALTVNLPTGLVIDTAKLLALDFTQPLGYLTCDDDSSTGTLHGNPGNVVYNNTTSVAFESLDDGGSAVTQNQAITQLWPFTWATSDSCGAEFVVPIVGFSSSTQMSDNADTRVCAAIVSGDPASATSGNPIIVPTVGYDSHGGYNASTGRYTCPTAGIYKLYGALQSASSATTLTIFKNAVSTALAGNLDSNGEATYGAAVNCAAGDIIDLRPGGTVDATSMTLNIERLSGPTAIAATETISARYYASGTSISGSLATISWTTKDFDTHGGMSSGTYTVPAAGKYRVTTQLTLAGTFALNNQNTIQIQKNGSAVSDATEYVAAAVTNYVIDIDDVISCAAGDTLRIQLSSGATLPTIVSSDTKNFISITRVGI